MKRLLFLLLAVLPLAAAEPSLSDQLRDALYAEEVERDPAKAAESYEKILADFDQQRPLAASALFRLAEVRRAQEKNEEAIALYQRLLREFSDREDEAKLASEHLAALGGELPSPDSPASPEQNELRRLQQLAKTAPDILRQRETLIKAIKTGNIKTIRFLIDQGADPNGERVLQTAAELGFIDVVKLLLESGGKPEPREAARAIDGAISNKRNQMLAFLLDQGIDPETSFDKETASWWFPLRKAVEAEDQEAIRILIKHGADPNRMHTIDGLPATGTLLHKAALISNIAWTRLLLEAGAGANPVSPNGGITPLHLAATKSGDEALAVIRLLLKAGADPNATITDPNVTTETWEMFLVGTPLEIAVQTRHSEQVAALIDGGADVTLRSLLLSLDRRLGNVQNTDPAIRSLVLPIEQSLGQMIGGGPKADAALFSLLLQHAPKLDPDSTNTSFLLKLAAERSFDISPLIARGATPSKVWMKQGFKGADWDKSIPLLNEKFLFPEITDSNRIQIVRTAWHNIDQRFSTLATKSNDSPPTSLAHSLFEADLKFHYFDDKELPVEWRRWRKSEDGTMSAIEFDPGADAPLPELEWGDIVELRTTGHPVHSASSNGIPSQGERESPATQWNFLRRISFPIKVTRGDEVSEITVRGDCLSYDPTKPIVPLFSAGYLSHLLYPDEYHQVTSKPLEVIVHREGWDPIRLSFDTQEWRTFPLQQNDRISIDAPLKDEASQLALRMEQIRLVVPGNHFSLYHEVTHPPILLPMLSELLTDTYAAWDVYTNIQISGLDEDPQTRFGQIAYSIRSEPGMMPIALPHPDFAAIRIRRLQEDGSEAIVTPRLAESIAAFTDQSTREQLAEGDIRLQPGDIVELPLTKSSEPWTGFSEQESRYFHRLLSGAFQLTDDKGIISRQTINWQPAELLASPCGPIPFQPESGTASTSAFALGQYSAHLRLLRNGEDFNSIRSRGFYIRDGDQLSPGISPDRRLVVPRGAAPRVVNPQR